MYSAGPAYGCMLVSIFFIVINEHWLDEHKIYVRKLAVLN